MSVDLCRFCLGETNLRPLFLDTDKAERHIVVLLLTTGLKVEPNDGLPQNICSSCTDCINNSIKFRNQCHSSEIELMKLGHKRNNLREILENTSKVSEANCSFKQQNDFCSNSNNDFLDDFGLPKFNVEVQFDRLSDSENGGSTQDGAEVSNKIVQPTMSKKEKRERYLELVDGGFDPKGPVKCKVCKKTLSKWACFTNHAKLHLGFKYMCEFCGKSFISSTQLKRHSRSLHGMARELPCKHCSYLALDKRQLVLHERRVHTGERPFVCDLCGASYHSRRCLVQHIEGHRESATVQCDLCSHKFKSSRHLSRHRYSAHGLKRKRARARERERAATQAAGET